MVIDTSIIVAILFAESDELALSATLGRAATRLLSAASFVKATFVVEGRKGASYRRFVERFVDQAEIEVVPVTVEQARLACQAFRQFGKGQHPAGLNFGDCFAYALAKTTGEPLLFKGNDFGKTDIISAL